MTDVSAGCPNLLDPDLITDLHAGFDRLRESGPVLAGLAMDGRPAWYITRLEDIRAVLADPRFVVRAESAPGRERDGVLDRMVELLGIPADLAGYLTENILTADGADHARLRNLVTRAFTARRIAALRPRIEMLAAELLDDLSGEVDLLDAFAYPLPVRVICELIGVPESDRSTWRRWNTALATLDHLSVPTVAREMIDYCHDLVRRRRADPADDLLSALAGARGEGGERLTDAEVVTMLITLVVNGHETTAQFIGNSTVTLVRHPDELRRVQDSPELWPTAVQELMRWCGPVTVTGLRYAMEDVEVAGVTIRAGDAVQPVLAAGNGDPRQRPDADQLTLTSRPERRGESHVGFGYGPHYCVGATLARQEGEIALRSLFQRFPNLTLSSEPRWMPRPGMRWLGELRVRLD